MFARLLRLVSARSLQALRASVAPGPKMMDANQWRAQYNTDHKAAKILATYFQDFLRIKSDRTALSDEFVTGPT